jgi:hypothetical protein
MLSDKDVAFLCADKELTNEEISELFDGCPGGVEADIFTYGGRTLILAHAAEPMRSRFSAQMRVKRKSRTR